MYSSWLRPRGYGQTRFFLRTIPLCETITFVSCQKVTPIRNRRQTFTKTALIEKRMRVLGLKRRGSNFPMTWKLMRTSASDYVCNEAHNFFKGVKWECARERVCAREGVLIWRGSEVYVLEIFPLVFNIFCHRDQASVFTTAVFSPIFVRFALRVWHSAVCLDRHLATSLEHSRNARNTSACIG